MRSLRFGPWLVLACCAPAAGPARAEGPAPAPIPAKEGRRVIYATADGLRWEEVFRGAADRLISKEDGDVDRLDATRARFGTGTPEERRMALMPFLWGTVAREGQILGNRDKNSPARVTNGKNFSYPGYNEMFTGKADPRVDSNAKRPNPNINVLEWLQGRPGFAGKVGVVGSWDVYPFVFNAGRSKLPINAGWEPIGGPSDEGRAMLDRVMAAAVRHWPDCRDDAFTAAVGLEVLRRDRPRAFYLGLGDTDEFAHEGRYDLYLESARRDDDAFRALWEWAQADPEYRGKTTLILSTDHGRGGPPKGWNGHGADVPGSDAIWIAAIGPDIPALGERSGRPEATQAQIAATIAAAVGEDFRADHPEAAPPIAEAFAPNRP